MPDSRDKLPRRTSLFERFLESQQSGGVLLSPDFRIQYANEYLRRWVGRSAAELEGENCYRVFHGRDSVCPDCPAGRALETGEPASVEHTGLSATGEKTHAALTLIPIRDEEGRLEYFVEKAENITERVRAEEDKAALLKAVARSEARFRMVVEQSSDAIWILHAAGGVRWLNSRAVDQGGRTVSDWNEDSFLHCVVEEDRDLVLDALAGALEGAPQTYQMRMRHVDGRISVLAVRSVPFMEEDAPPGTVSFAKDITAQKVAEAALLLSEAQLRQAQKMEAIGQLAGGVAHDFNNLLTVICAQTELALETLPPDDPLCADLTEVANAGRSASDLTRQLLAFSRRQQLETRVLSLNDVVESLEKMVPRLLGEDVELRLELDTRLACVRADPGQLEQVIANLAVNARDAMPRGGMLTIRTANVVLDAAFVARNPGAVTGEHVLLRVSDTGTGMTEEVKQHLFEPFFTTKDLGRGTGLGLATVYGIVKQSEGYIVVESELGRGSAFGIYLPRVDGPVDGAAGGTGVRPNAVLDGGTETILLVEDQSAVRRALHRMLTRLGYRVVEAASAQEGLAVHERTPDAFDLVLTDVVMPEMSGVELVRHLRARGRRGPVVYMTGYTEETISGQGLRESGVPLLHKPVSMRVLAALLRQVLDPQSANRS